MEKFDFDSKKYVLLLVLVCLVFFILIVKAFDYLPESAENNKTISRQTVTIDNNYRAESSSSKYEETDYSAKKIDQKSGSFMLNESTISNDEPIQTVSKRQTPVLDEIKAPAGVGLEPIDETDSAEQVSEEKSEPELSSQEKAELALMMGNKFRKSANLSSALSEYQKVPGLTNDKDLVASSYEGIATLYAMNKKYGTALNYAARAYNTSPNSSREMLLARLYYKTGDIDKATKRINNLLHRDFADDKQ